MAELQITTNLTAGNNTHLYYISVSVDQESGLSFSWFSASESYLSAALRVLARVAASPQVSTGEESSSRPT